MEKEAYGLLSVISQEELEKEIAKKIAQFQGLLTREAAMKLIAKEMGLLKNEARVYKIGEIPHAARKINFTAKILRIEAPVTYSSGKKSRSIILGDETGRIRLKLWGEDLELFSKFKIGDIVEVKNAYERNGELGLGYAGEIRVVNAAPFSQLGELEASTYVNVRGRITRIEGEKEYLKEGKRKRFFVFSISDGVTEKQCVIWEGIGRGRQLNVNDEVVIEQAYVKNDELHVYGKSRILLRPSGLRGKVKSIDCDGNTLKVTIDEKQIVLNREEALKFLGVDVKDDISLEVIANLKKNFIIDNNNNNVGSNSSQ
jgi:hypothetical protein